MTSSQRRRVEAEARPRKNSVGSLVRDAVDAERGGVTQEERRAALEEIRAMRGRFLFPEDATPEGINRLAASEHDEALDEMLRHITPRRSS